MERPRQRQHRTLGASPAVAVAANRDQNIFWSGTNSDLREGPLRRQQTEPPLNVK
jgi:hypothetical protein